MTFNFATKQEMRSAKELRGVCHWCGGECDEKSIWDGENCQSSHEPLSEVWKPELVVELNNYLNPLCDFQQEGSVVYSLSSLVTGKLGMDGNKGQGDLGYQQGLF